MNTTSSLTNPASAGNDLLATNLADIDSRLGAKPDPLYERLMHWSFAPLVERLVEKHGMTQDDASQAFADTKRFLYLCHIRPAGSGMHMSPPEAIDQAWHVFLLYTRVYARFCDDFFGRFMHHTPFTLSQRERMRANGDALKTLKATIALAKDTFGTLSPLWDEQLLHKSGDEFASGCSNCGGSTNCGGNDAPCC